MKTHIQSSASSIRFAGLVAFFVAASSFIVTASTLGRVAKIDPKNFEILGIRLGSSTIGDLKHILGSAPERQSIDSANTVMCYASLGSDRTVLEFENWTDPIEFRFFHGSLHEVARCATSPKISDSLSTASGLKLGMTQQQVVMILGQPHRMYGNHYSYESSFLRPLTPEERKRAKATHPVPKTMEVYEKIDLQFNGSKVIRIDAVYSETW
jgi:hypothetical protein